MEEAARITVLAKRASDASMRSISAFSAGEPAVAPP
jgi:hypothetical protein